MHCDSYCILVWQSLSFHTEFVFVIESPRKNIHRVELSCSVLRAESSIQQSLLWIISTFLVLVNLSSWRFFSFLPGSEIFRWVDFLFLTTRFFFSLKIIEQADLVLGREQSDSSVWLDTRPCSSWLEENSRNWLHGWIQDLVHCDWRKTIDHVLSTQATCVTEFQP